MNKYIRKLIDYLSGKISMFRKLLLNLHMRFYAWTRTQNNDFKIRRTACNKFNESKWTSYLSKNEGTRTFKPDEIPDSNNIVLICKELLERRTSEFNELQESTGKSYLFNILKDEDFAEYPELLEFALSKPIIEILSGYLGYIPRLGAIDLLITLPGPVKKGSQWLHRDAGDPDNVKCFINITEVKQENGPLHVLPKINSRFFLWRAKSITGNRKFPDHVVNSYINKNDFITNIGETGSGLFADTSKCLHFGGRVEKNMRVMLVIHYSRFSFGGTYKPSESIREKYAIDEAKKILLKIDK